MPGGVNAASGARATSPTRAPHERMLVAAGQRASKRTVYRASIRALVARCAVALARVARLRRRRRSARRWRSRCPCRHTGDEHFAVVEHEYVTYLLGQFPVVATYLGGAAFDPQLAAVDGTAARLLARGAAEGGCAARRSSAPQLLGDCAGEPVGAAPHRPLRRPGADRLPAAPTPGASLPAALPGLLRR